MNNILDISKFVYYSMKSERRLRMDTGKRRNIIITGGNSGMGRAIAEAFVRGHDQVAIIGRDREKLQAAAQALGSNVSWYQADVSQREQVASTAANIVKQWDHIDVLVNAAGFGRNVTTDMPLEEAEREWDALYGTN